MPKILDTTDEKKTGDEQILTGPVSLSFEQGNGTIIAIEAKLEVDEEFKPLFTKNASDEPFARVTSAFVIRAIVRNNKQGEQVTVRMVSL